MNIFTTLTALFIEKAHANVFTNYCTILHGGCGSGAAFLIQLSARALEFFAILIAGAAVIAIVYGAIRLITSGGNDTGKEEAKKIITTALIGLFLALAAEAIIVMTMNVILTIPGTT